MIAEGSARSPSRKQRRTNTQPYSEASAGLAAERVVLAGGDGEGEVEGVGGVQGGETFWEGRGEIECGC